MPRPIKTTNPHCCKPTPCTGCPYPIHCEAATVKAPKPAKSSKS